MTDNQPMKLLLKIIQIQQQDSALRDTYLKAINERASVLESLSRSLLRDDFTDAEDKMNLARKMEGAGIKKQMSAILAAIESRQETTEALIAQLQRALGGHGEEPAAED